MAFSLEPTYLKGNPPELAGCAKTTFSHFPNHNRNIKISKALLKSQAHQGIISLFTSAATNQRGFPNGVKRSSGLFSRIPGRDRVAVKVGIVQMERVNDQMSQGRSV